MYSKLQHAKKYLQYYFRGSNGKGHGTHSPFIFHFITHVLNDRKHYPEYEKVESLRTRLLNNKLMLTVEDFGAGSSTTKNTKRSISSIAMYAAKPKKYGQLLYRMVKAYQPKTILELGTSLGITTTYLSITNPDAKVISMEGSEEIAGVALKNLQNLHIENAEIVMGNFDYTLASVINTLSVIDFIFIDGNHRREPTERYLNQLLQKTNNDSIIILDDIHWSREMEQAWENIKKHPAVRCSVDLFFIGIIFFRLEFKEKQHFSIRF